VSFFPARTGVHACEFGESPNNWENREKRSAKRRDLGLAHAKGGLPPSARARRTMRNLALATESFLFASSFGGN
jgi:hypothetical protein